VGDGDKLLTHLNSTLKVLSGLDIFPRGTKKKLNFVDQCYGYGDAPQSYVTSLLLLGLIDRFIYAIFY
jgi:hypothetical protein